MPTSLVYRPFIDALRALAIIFVVGFHAFPNYMPGGFIGVDIFFVISGYLISSIIFKSLEEGNFSFKNFYSRRIKRIFPALLTMLFASYVIGWLILLPDEFMLLGKHIAAAAGFIANFVYWSETGYFTFVFSFIPDSNPLLHLWSISIEEQFYLIWPVLLSIAWKCRRILLPSIIVLTAISFYVNITLSEIEGVTAFFMPFTRFWELMLGSILAYISQYKLSYEFLSKKMLFGKLINSKIHLIIKNISSLLGILLIFYGVFTITKDQTYPGFNALIPTIGTILIITAGKEAWLNRIVLSNAILVWIGLISYPLYLWHWPVLNFIRIYENQVPNILVRVNAIYVSVFLAWLTYEFIEKPIRFRSTNRKIIAILIALMLLIGCLGFNVYWRNGIDERRSSNISRLNKFDFPYVEKCDVLTKVSYSEDSCHVSESSENDSLLLIGDSHANSFSTVLSSLRKKYVFSFIQFGRAGCFGLLNYGIPPCKEIAEDSLNYTKTHPSIKYILLAARWTIASQNHTKKGITVEAKAYEDALRNTINAYELLGKKVILIFNVPTNSDPRTCITRSFPFNKNINCANSRQAINYNQKTYRKFFSKLRIEYSSLNFFDPVEYLCDADTCKLVDGDKILYRDFSHISVFGGEYIAQKAEAELVQLLNLQSRKTLHEHKKQKTF